MSEPYPFPFTPSIMNDFGGNKPIWERLAPEWSPETGIPLHLFCLAEMLECSGLLLGLLGNLHDKMVAAGSEFVDDVDVIGRTTFAALHALNECVTFGKETVMIDPVIAGNIMKAQRNGLRVATTPEAPLIPAFELLQPSRYYTIQETAAIMRMERHKVSRLLHSGQLRGAFHGNKWTIQGIDIEAYMRKKADETQKKHISKGRRR